MKFGPQMMEEKQSFLVSPNKWNFGILLDVEIVDNFA